MTATAPDGRSLVGSAVRLDPMTPDDAAGLFRALDDPRVWAAGYGGGPAARPADLPAMTAWVAAALLARDAGSRRPYVVRVPGGEVVGTTSLLDWVPRDERVHLGATAYAPRCWGSVVNAESKLLLLGHAFDACGFGRVKLQTDARNERSQRAIAGLGATREGVLRRHVRRADGSFRDTVVFSVLVDEWPRVAAGLRARVASTGVP